MKLQPREDNEYDVAIGREPFETLVCAAKWVLDKRKGKVPRRAKGCLMKIVESYQKKRPRRALLPNFSAGASQRAVVKY